MAKSAAEHTSDILLEFLPGLLPKPIDSAAKGLVGTFKEQLDVYLAQPRIRRELLEAARTAETDFRLEARKSMQSDELAQAVASYSIWDRELFQSALQSLPDHLDEELLAKDLQALITDDWNGKFTPDELRQGTAIYLNCLRVQLLKVEGFAEIVTRLATLRTAVQTEQILQIVTELLTLVKKLVEKSTVGPNITYSLFTIPPPVADFTGRTQELDELKSAFSRGALITGVTGSGGIGKTALAQKLAWELQDQFPDARLEINLLGTSQTPLTSEDALRRLLEPFYPEQKLPNDPGQLHGLYQQTLSARKSLLLLDNAADADQVKPLIPPSPSAAIVTSRQHFTLTEHHLHPLRLDVLPLEQARELLRATAPKLAGAPDIEVDRLAVLCGRLPLALRVAASLLEDRDDWSLTTLLSRLTDERTRLQRLKRPTDLDVEATIVLSYDLLSGELQKAFRYLSVFPAPFLSNSAARIWGLSENDDVEDFIGKLLNRSLLKYLPSQLGSLDLYDLHDLTRLFATQRLLEDQAQAKEALDRHAGHFLELASQANDEYIRGNEHIPMGLSLFRFIWPHLMADYQRLLPGMQTLYRPETADRWLSDFPDSCAYLLDLHLPPRERIPLLEGALAASRRLEDKQAEGVHLGNLGNAYYALGDAHKAIQFYEQILVIHREIGDRRGEGADLGNLGSAYAALGDALKAIQFYEQALVIDREIGDRRGEGADLGNLGLAYYALGDAHKAIQFYEQQLIIVRQIGDRRGEGTDISNLGNAYAALGDAHKAIQFYEQSLVIARQIGDRRGEGKALGNLGTAYAALGDAHKAIQFHEQSFVIARQIGDRRGEGNALGNLGTAYAALGDAHKAIQFYEQRLVIDRQIGNRRGEGADLGNLGTAYAALGDIHKAIQFYEQSLVIARQIGDRRGEAFGSWNLGNAYEKLNEIEKAIAAKQICVNYEREINHPNAEKHAQKVEELKKKLK